LGLFDDAGEEPADFDEDPGVEPYVYFYYLEQLTYLGEGVFIQFSYLGHLCPILCRY
jgi:hypothetical protein